MKNEKILLFEDRSKKADLDRMAEAVCNGANDLISTIHAFQSWRKITTVEQFNVLIQDPIKFMDDVLIEKSGVDISKTGGVLPVPAIIAPMFGVDRESYVRIIKGETVLEGTCKPCSKIVRVSKSGKGVLSYSTYSRYKDLLTFSKGRFIVDESAVEAEKEKFNYYAETPDQIKERDFWYGACDVLNELNKRGFGTDLDSLSKTLNGIITFSYQVGKLSVDDGALFGTIQRLKSN